jgi:hypothetical protein
VGDVRKVAIGAPKSSVRDRVTHGLLRGIYVRRQHEIATAVALNGFVPTSKSLPHQIR